MENLDPSSLYEGWVGPLWGKNGHSPLSGSTWRPGEAVSSLKKGKTHCYSSKSCLLSMGGSRSRPYVYSLKGWLLNVDQGKERRKRFPRVEPKGARHAKRRGGKKAVEEMREPWRWKIQHSRKPLPCILGPGVYDRGVVWGFLYLTAFQELPEPGNGSWGEVELC